MIFLDVVSTMFHFHTMKGDVHRIYKSRAFLAHSNSGHQVQRRKLEATIPFTLKQHCSSVTSLKLMAAVADTWESLYWTSWQCLCLVEHFAATWIYLTNTMDRCLVYKLLALSALSVLPANQVCYCPFITAHSKYGWSSNVEALKCRFMKPCVHTVLLCKS